VGTELELSLGIATLRVELADFVAVTKSLAGTATGSGAREEFRRALREMISEATKSCETFDSADHRGVQCASSRPARPAHRWTVLR
jgi:hypothetical protein